MRSVKVERKPRSRARQGAAARAARRHARDRTARDLRQAREMPGHGLFARVGQAIRRWLSLPPPDASAHGWLCRRGAHRGAVRRRLCRPHGPRRQRDDSTRLSTMPASASPKCISPATRARRRNRSSPRSASSRANRSSAPISSPRAAPDEARLGRRGRRPAPLSRRDLRPHRREAALRAVEVADGRSMWSSATAA